MIKRDIIYMYDGSFEGFLTCVFESFKNKEEPFDIVHSEDTQPSLLPSFYIAADLEKSQRVWESIPAKMGQEMLFFIQYAFLSCLKQKEIYILRVMRLGYKNGEKTLSNLSDDSVLILTKAVKNLLSEAHQFKQFIRFEDYKGILFAKIKAKNKVLQILAEHFIDRLPQEKFLIYDEANKMVCVYSKGKCSIYETQDFCMPDISKEGDVYQALWEKFYETIAIESRINHKLRQSHMPKRYWSNIVEMKKSL